MSKLPSNLKIRKVCDQFMANYLPSDCQDSLVEPSLLLNNEYMQKFASDYTNNMNLSLDGQNEQTKKGLLKALISTFGYEFSYLGILKLINDSLNFSGPLLLNQLVKFVETKSDNLNIKKNDEYSEIKFLYQLF